MRVEWETMYDEGECTHIAGVIASPLGQSRDTVMLTHNGDTIPDDKLYEPFAYCPRCGVPSKDTLRAELMAKPIYADEKR